jgi:hypothetical protein
VFLQGIHGVAPAVTTPLIGEGVRLAICEQLSAMGLRMSRLGAERILARLPDAPTPATLNREVGSLWERLRDEVETVFLLHLPEQERRMYEVTEPFGAEVAVNFPSVSYDVEEAGKCLALDRSTASAFHSVRCLEAGIGALSRCLHIPDPTKGAQRSWFKLLEAIKNETDRRWPPSHIRAGDAQLFEEAYAALAGMQNPWRNATMHLDQKYTSEDARHIFEMVGGFMRRIASRMDENGEPKVP